MKNKIGMKNKEKVVLIFQVFSKTFMGHHWEHAEVTALWSIRYFGL